MARKAVGRLSLLFLLTCLASTLTAEPFPDSDHRAWQHGVNLVKVGERLLLVWGSAGNPPQPKLSADWPHDVYYAWLNPKDVTGNQPISINPKTLVSQPEAQEPPSVAVNNKGTILMTTEDGHGGINQNAGLWDSSLKVLREYPFEVREGGHSGHAAALNDLFLVTYGEGWVDGGGWRGVGTGESVYARIINNAGELGRELELTDKDNPRDGWPLVAASDRNWLVIWQRYPEMTLQSALISPSGKIIKRLTIMKKMPLRYAYGVTYVPQLSAYAVSGSNRDGGFISLIGVDGRILKTAKKLPFMAAESHLIVNQEKNPIGLYPVKPNGLALVSLDAKSIKLIKVIDNPHKWDYSGTTGLFVAPDKALIATLSTSGLHLIPVDAKH
jgi:hypothetical protein